MSGVNSLGTSSKRTETMEGVGCLGGIKIVPIERFYLNQYSQETDL